MEFMENILIMGNQMENEMGHGMETIVLDRGYGL